MRSPVIAILGLAACGVGEPVYIQPDPLVMMVEPGAVDLEDGMLPAALTIQVPFLEETEAQREKRQALADRFGVPLDIVPRARRADVELEVEWTIRNLEQQNGVASFFVLASNEFFRYDPTLFVIDPEEDEPPPPLIGGEPIELGPGETKTGTLREDQLYEAAQDLDAISRGGVIPQYALITRWPTEDVPAENGMGGALNGIPSELVPLLLQLDVSLSTNVPVELSFALRMRDRSDRIKVPLEEGDVVVPPSTTAFVPATPPEEKR
jgi:hypothetical protein